MPRPFGTLERFFGTKSDRTFPQFDRTGIELSAPPDAVRPSGQRGFLRYLRGLIKLPSIVRVIAWRVYRTSSLAGVCEESAGQAPFDGDWGRSPRFPQANTSQIPSHMQLARSIH
jgi:hypothetical protein